MTTKVTKSKENSTNIKTKEKQNSLLSRMALDI